MECDHDDLFRERGTDPLMTEARVQANRRATREGAPMFIYEGERHLPGHLKERAVYVRSTDEGQPEGATLVEIINSAGKVTP